MNISQDEFMEALQRDLENGSTVPYFDVQGNKIGRIISGRIKDDYIEVDVQLDSDNSFIKCRIT